MTKMRLVVNAVDDFCMDSQLKPTVTFVQDIDVTFRHEQNSLSSANARRSKNSQMKWIYSRPRLI